MANEEYLAIHKQCLPDLVAKVKKLRPKGLGKAELRLLGRLP